MVTITLMLCTYNIIFVVFLVVTFLLTRPVETLIITNLQSLGNCVKYTTPCFMHIALKFLFSKDNGSDFILNEYDVDLCLMNVLKKILGSDSYFLAIFLGRN